MTNVPQNLRDLWKDIYVLFDKNYLMKNDKKSWDSFWKQATEIGNKYDGCPYLFKMFDLVSFMIEQRMIAENDVRSEKPTVVPPPPVQQEMGLF